MAEETEYDFVILGSGIGGLECAYILADEGYKVVVLEKNHQIGGNLQVFSRDKSIFDTGVHYIGSLDEGECLNQYFKYFKLRDTLKWKRLDDDCFDLITFNDGSEHKFGQGYDNFKRNLKTDFPEEHQAIDDYCTKVQEICNKFPLYNLQDTQIENYVYDMGFLETNASNFIDSITTNQKLRNLLGAHNGLYAGIRTKSPFYVHALITNSYIMGSYRLQDGGSQLAIHLSRSIRKMGGKILKRKKVISANFSDEGNITSVVMADGSVIKGKNFISNIHPAVTIDIFGENRFLKAYRNRIKTLENTASSFVLHLVFKENAFEYINHNIYQCNGGETWGGMDSSESTWPENMFICTPASTKSVQYADCMTAMTYMNYKDVEQWDESLNTIAEPGKRGEGYEAFKKEKQERMIQSLEKRWPDIRSKIKSIHSSTPLTFRDYIGDKEGSLYGILKNSESPLRSVINSSTKIPNLYLTGQNLILHGILGATIGALVTCFNFVDKKKLMKKVTSAK